MLYALQNQPESAFMCRYPVHTKAVYKLDTEIEVTALTSALGPPLLW